LLAALAWTGLILFFCLIKSSSVPVIKIPNIDKAVHISFHFGFTMLWFLFFQHVVATPIKKRLSIVFVFSLVFGILIEIAQSLFTTSRSGDVLDVLANTTGALLACSVLIYYFKRKNIKL
jgi:VanZ family protein